MLRQTLSSLLQQTILPREIQVHYSSSISSSETTTTITTTTTTNLLQEEEEDHSNSNSSSSSSKSRTDLIHFYTHSDPRWRSATKLLGALYLEWGNTTTGPPSRTRNNNKNNHHKDEDEDDETLIVVADDDFIYSKRWLESLLVGYLDLNANNTTATSTASTAAAVGLRGWRVKQDLTWGAPPIVVSTSDGVTPPPDGVWGSFPSTERYIIQGSKIREPYRVSVLTAVHGILYRSSFFSSSSSNDDESSQNIFQAPSEIHFSMDDIWCSGYLANRSIPRFVVPMLGGGTIITNTADVGIHLGQHKSVIDPQNKKVSRRQANNIVLKYFSQAWENENLWWSNNNNNNMDGPKLRGFLPLRHWLSEHVILGLYSISWIRNLVGTWKLVDE